MLYLSLSLTTGSGFMMGGSMRMADQSPNGGELFGVRRSDRYAKRFALHALAPCAMSSAFAHTQRLLAI